MRTHEAAKRKVKAFAAPLLIVAALVLICVSPAQPMPVSFAADDLDDFLHPPGSDWALLFLDNANATSVAVTPNGYIVAGSQTGEPFPHIWTALAKLDWNGNVVDWATFEGEGHPNIAYSVIPNYISETEVDGYVVTGYMHHFYSEDRKEWYDPDVWLMKTSTSLDKVWGVTFGDPYNDHGNSVIRDGTGYLIGGWQDVGGAGSGWLIRADGDGNLDWDFLLEVGNPDTWWIGSEVLSVSAAWGGGYILGTRNGIVKTSGGPSPSFEWRAGSDEYYSVQKTSDGGYIGAGRTDGLASTYDIILTKVSAPGAVEWSHTFGINEPISWLGTPPKPTSEIGRSVAQTTDGGYILVGSTDSYGDASAGVWFRGHGGTDVWLIKTDANGDMEWDIALGGEGNDAGYGVVESPDGDYVVAGGATFEGSSRMWIMKVNGSQPPIPSFVYSPSSPVFVGEPVRFDASASHDPDGALVTYEWDFGDGKSGTGAIVQHVYRAPGGYTTTLYVTDDHGEVRSTSQQVTVVKQVLQWERRIGGAKGNAGNSIIPARDGGFIVAGYTLNSAYGGQYPDLWLFKTDARGRVVWEKRYADWDNSPQNIQSAASVAWAHDGGYIVVGKTDTGFGVRGTDLWLLKTDINGNLEWDKTFGGNYRDEGASVAPTADGGYIITGLTADESHLNAIDLWLMKVDVAGNPIWSQVFEDPGFFEGNWVIPTSDNGYAVTGGYSPGAHTVPLVKTGGGGVADWTKKWTGVGAYDHGYWVGEATGGGFVVAGCLDADLGFMKADDEGHHMWSRTYGGDSLDCAYGAAKTADGGFVATGITIPGAGIADDIYLVKVDSEGYLEWDMAFGTPTATDEGLGVMALGDGSYIVLGYTYPDRDVWLFKVGPNRLPQAQFSYVPPSPTSGQAVTFNASASTDPDGTLVAYEWDFGDGSAGTGMAPAHTYAADSTYTVRLTVADEDGGEATTTQVLTVAQALSANFSGMPSSGLVPHTVWFTDWSIGGTPPNTYAWDLDGDGDVDSTARNPMWTYTAPGMYDVTLDVMDNAGASSRKTRSDYVIATGIISLSGDVTITSMAVTDCPACDPARYDISGAPPSVDIWDAHGFVISATGPDGVYRFRITLSSPIDSEFALYKLPGWERMSYTIIDSHTIEVELEIAGGVLDPPFILARTTTATTSVSLVIGLNFIGLPLQPLLSMTAESFEAELESQGCLIDQIDRWNASTGMWQSYKAGITAGFPIIPGEGYFLKASRGCTWTMEGYPFAMSVPLSLVVGLNSVAIPYPPSVYTAPTLAAAIAVQGGAVDQVDMWNESTGMWNSHKVSPPLGDFPILGWRGYFLKVTQATTFLP